MSDHNEKSSESLQPDRICFGRYCNILSYIHVYTECTFTVCSAYEHPPKVLWPPEQDDWQWTRNYLQVYQDHFCVLSQNGFHRTHLNKPWGKSIIRHHSGQKGRKEVTFGFWISSFVLQLDCYLNIRLRMMKGVTFLFNVFVMQCYCKFNRSCTMFMYMYSSEILFLSCLRLYNLVWKYKTSLK